MARTHRCMITAPVVETVVDGQATLGCQIWQDYPGTLYDMRIRSISPPGEAQPVDNWPSQPNISTFYVESDLATLNLLAADPDYIILMPIEEIPVEETL